MLACLAAACDRPVTSTREFVALGTVVTISAYGVAGERFESAATDIERYLMSAGAAWYPASAGELHDLNEALAAGRSFVVSAALADLLKRSAALERRSGGRFNACIGRFSALWGFYDFERAPTELPDPAALARVAAARPSCTQLAVDDTGPTVSTTNPAVAVDVGGIAKGALLAEAARRLRARGIEDAIVNLGGDLLVLGRVHGRDARIGIRAPAAGAPLAWLDARPGEAVFTSGNYERYFEIGGRRYAHILDPSTGWPVGHTAAVTVVHTDPTLADAAATALLVGGMAAFDEQVEAFGLEYALLVDTKGDTRLTSGMAERLHWLGPGT